MLSLRFPRPFVRGGLVAGALIGVVALGAPAAEWNPVRRTPPSLGPEGDRIIVGFKPTPGNQWVHVVRRRQGDGDRRIVLAATTAKDAAALAGRAGVGIAGSRQLTPAMHLLLLPQRLYGAAIIATLDRLRADPAVAFAAIDARRYAEAIPNDPLFLPTPDANPPASGQWYLQAPSSTPITVAGLSTTDQSATDAVSAWNLTTGSTGIVIADVDTGVRFDHPDLLRAGASSLGTGFAGRLLPGYDFVGEDYDPTTAAPLGTFLIANDGDGWDPDPSDPGDWISSTDVLNKLFPTAACGDPSQSGGLIPSSWHGTRVVGLYGALTDNAIGVAGMSWGPWILPVRAIGKCGGYDSDIVTGIGWAAGMPVSGVPDNPYPADIINLSLGGTASACDASSTYYQALAPVTQMGVLVVISAGNENGPVDTPANCSATVPGVVAVAGLRNVGTKVGYSSFGSEVTIAAPAGNCLLSSGNCLRSIDTTVNAGTTVPASNGYTNELQTNLGTSFSAPIVSGIAALMRSVNANLTPVQLAARLQSSANPFPAGSAGLAICPALSADGECACPNDGSQCGAGMVDAYRAVSSALKPIGVIAIPSPLAAGSVLDASASVAACNTAVSPPAPLTIASFAWSATPGTLIVSGANTAKPVVDPGSGGTLVLTVTDSAGHVDTETVMLTADSATSSAPASTTGTSATACPSALAVNPGAPTVSASYSPASVVTNAAATLTVTFTNPNGFALTQASFNLSYPAGLGLATAAQGGGSAAAATTCTGAALTSSFTATGVALSHANIPADGSCSIVVPVASASAGNYATQIAVNALTTAPAGGNSVAATAILTVTSPPTKGGGALGWYDLLVAACLIGQGARRDGVAAARGGGPAGRDRS
jgi:serine protease